VRRIYRSLVWERIHSTQRNLTATRTFGVRREAKHHAALAGRLAVEKRCRRCALPPQSKPLARTNRNVNRADPSTRKGAVKCF